MSRKHCTCEAFTAHLSSLGGHCSCQPGIRAIPTSKQQKVDPSTKAKVKNSLDVDSCFAALQPNDSRWDYLLFLECNGQTSVIAIEIHQANEYQIDKVRKKKEWLDKLFSSAPSLRKCIRAYYWVGTSGVHIPPTHIHRIAAMGIQVTGHVSHRCS